MLLYTFLQEPVFENCSCSAARLLDMPAYGNATYSEVLGNTSTAGDGVCDQGCNQLGLLGLAAVTLFLAFMLYTPNAHITLRYTMDVEFVLVLRAGKQYVYKCLE